LRWFGKRSQRPQVIFNHVEGRGPENLLQKNLGLSEKRYVQYKKGDMLEV